MLEKTTLKEILEVCLETGGDFAEIFEERKFKSSYSMLNGIVENANSGIVYGVGIRIYQGTNSVYAYTNDTTYDHLIETAKNLSAAIEGEKKEVSFELKEVTYENHHPVTKRPSLYDSAYKIAIMKKANDAA